MRFSIIGLILTLVVSCPFCAASDCSISGQVVDNETGQPISGVSILLKGTTSGISTDTEGLFHIAALVLPEMALIVSRVGYGKVEQIVNFADDCTAYLLIRLEPEVIELNNLNVTASRFREESFNSPVGISVTSEKEISERTYSSTAEVLREEPGILVQKTTCGHGAPILRGLIGKHVLLLYDGIRLNRPTFRLGANQYLNTVNLASLDRIEVVRGPSSVMYGSDAMGGVVNLIPSNSSIHHDKIKIIPEFSTRYSTADNGSSSNLHLAGHYLQWATSVNVSYKKIGDLRAGGDIGRQSPTGWEEINFNGRLSYYLNKDNVFYCDYLSVNQTDVPRYDKYVSGDFEKYIYDPQDRDLYAVTFNSLGVSKAIKEIKTNISYSDENEGRTEQRSGSTTIKESIDNLTTYGTYFQISIVPVKHQTLSFGWEYYHDIAKSHKVKISDGQEEVTRPTYPDNSKYYSLGIFLQHCVALLDELKMTSGARFSSFKLKSPLEEPYGIVDEIYNDVTGSLALTLSLDSYINLIARWSRGFYAPNLNDVAVLKTSSSGVDVPSIGLAPENSNNFEIGMKVNSPRYRGSLFAYYNRLNDLIDRKPGIYNGLTFFDENNNGLQDPREFDVYQRKNVSQAYIVGFEFDGLLKINSAWELRSNCFWTRGENRTNDEPLSRIPSIMGIAAVRCYAGQYSWYEVYIRAATDQRRLSTRDKDDTRIDPNGTPGWATLNFRTQLTAKRIQITFLFENILDKGYKEHGSGVYSPGRNLLISLKYGVF
jgi:outer membrane receptor for ferrienterochelin and colicin